MPFCGPPPGALDQAVGKLDGRRHQHLGLVGGVAEHQALVAGTLVFRFGPVHALIDVGRLARRSRS